MMIRGNFLTRFNGGGFSPLLNQTSPFNKRRTFQSEMIRKKEDQQVTDIFIFKSQQEPVEALEKIEKKLTKSDFIADTPQSHVMKGTSEFVPHERVFEAIENVESYSHIKGEEALMVFDLNRVADKLETWKKAFPQVSPHYAVKANPQPELIEYMAKDLNMSFDCASPSEIELVLSYGVDPDRIIYANPTKSIPHIEYARAHGVKKMTFDSPSELFKVQSVYPDADLVLRIWTDDSDAQCSLSNKYGATTEESVELLTLAKQLNLNIIGVSFHAGSGGSQDTYVSALRDAHMIFQKGKTEGFDMKLLDIGGGFPASETAECSVKNIGELLQPIISHPDWSGVEIISEPGRFFCAEAVTLAVKVMGKRKRGGLINYYVNDGLYKSFNCIMYDHSGEVSYNTQVKSQDEVPLLPSIIFGQSCDGLDTISSGLLLPELKLNDGLMFPVMGAYTNTASSNFNGFQHTDKLIIDPVQQENPQASS